MTQKIELSTTGKSYSTRKRLETALEKSGLLNHSDLRYMIVKNPDTNRFTAVFFGHNTAPAFCGFMIIG